jgi:2',3'-cyclic-nucleotide 2'-phosphodiesterase (5'-nucleotidase family)
LTADLPAISRASLVGPWQALPVAEVARKYAREIDDQVDLVVALAHITPSEEDEILNSVPEVDLIISGHVHAGQQEVKSVDGRLCVKVPAFGRELGRLDLTVEPGQDRIASYEWTRIAISRGAFPPDPEVAAIVDKWEKKVGEAVDVKIGFATRAIRTKQELQPLIEEMMMDAVGADLAYNNPGGIRAELPAGDIRVRDVWNIEPFGNYIAYDTVKGSDLPEELTERGGIDPDKLYIVATNDFIAEKWREQGLDLTQEGPSVRDAMITWIKANKTVP